MREQVVFCWSGGKDSALALYKVLRSGACEVGSLLTTCNEHFQRVSMHGVRLELIDQQAQALGLPLEKMFVSQRSSNAEYLEKLTDRLRVYKSRGVAQVAFGDIFLEDLKRWRDEQLATLGLSGLYPLWKMDSGRLVREFIDLGFRAVVCCVNDAYLDASFLGRTIDAEFLASLPPGIDPSGENGEFHSLTFAGPIFKQPLRFEIGAKVYRPVEETHPGSVTASGVAPIPVARRAKGFWFCDLIPA
jgi:uncharacterized protein (TIGR00290 family)